MSTNDPTQPEYLGSGAPAGDPTSPSEDRKGRGRTGIAVAVAVVVAVLAAVGAGAYGVAQLMSGGSSPASAVPAGAVGYASLDLDPSAAQKIEAVKILRKFPGLKSQLNIGSRDDLRRTVFEQLTKDGGCKGVDYDSDVKPWIGDRIAVAAVPSAASGVLPLVLVQVTDEDKARAGVRTLERCDTSGDAPTTGVAFVGDYMLLTEKKADAARMAKAAESSALADDPGFKSWMGRVGDPGIITMYASKNAPAAAQRTGRAQQRSGTDQLVPGGTKQLEAAFKHFQGAAGVVRFKDGAVEAEFATKGLDKGVGAGGESGPDVASLPATTAAALSVSFKDGWLDSYLAQARSSAGASAFDDMLSQAEKATGLQLPGDIETLLGKGVSVSVDAGADLKSLSHSPDPTTIPAGIRIRGDATKITAIIDKLKAVAGPDANLVQVRSKDGTVAVGTDPAYVASLLEKGDLGGTAAFKRVVPQAGRASGVLFVSFDAGHGWAERLADLASDGDPKAKANIKPLDALGISSWQDGDQVQHGFVRLTTD